MKKVREGVYWCPKYNDLKPKPCPDPPSKEKLIDIANKLSSEQAKDIGLQEGRIPDKDWLIQIIAVLDNDCIIYNKDYRPPINETKRHSIMIDNNDSFFTDLPPLIRKKDLRCKTRFFQKDLATFQSKIDNMKERKAQLEYKIQFKADELNKMSQKKKLVKINEDDLLMMKEKIRNFEEEKFSQSNKKKKGRN